MKIQHTICAIILGSQFLCEIATAGDRRFTYVYESTTAAKGEVEVENWATWKTRREGSGRINQFQFRHELEYGVTDRLQAAVYVADWQVNQGQVAYKDTALELIYNMTNPVTDLLGSALYGEVKLGDQQFKLEGKLLLQKNFGPIVIAYNAGIEAEWEGERFGIYDERSGEFMESFGVSYQVSPHFLLGGEFLHEVGFDEWQDAGDPVIYAGPNASFRLDRFFVTTTAMVQVTGVTDEADFQLRTIVGMHF